MSFGTLFLCFFLEYFSKKLMRKASMRNKVPTEQISNDRFGTNLRCYSGIILGHFHHRSCNSKRHSQQNINFILIFPFQKLTIYIDHPLGCRICRQIARNILACTRRNIDYRASLFSISHDWNHHAI